jgi:hypothetical protein
MRAAILARLRRRLDRASLQANAEGKVPTGEVLLNLTVEQLRWLERELQPATDWEYGLKRCAYCGKRREP